MLRGCDHRAMSMLEPAAGDLAITPPVTPPEDWPALWQAMLHARTAPLHTPGPGGRLAAGAASGWRLAGPCSAASAALFEIYKPLLDAHLAQARGAAAAVTTAMPWALAQLGQSLDGCVATAAGDSYFVTGPESLVHLHRLRALCDAVLVGAGTVAVDDPLLTTRHVPGPHPVRVVLDPAARLDGSARVLRDATATTLWLCDSRHAGAAQARVGITRGAGPDVLPPTMAASSTAEVLAVDGLLDAAHPARGPDLARAFAALAGRGLRVLLVEGGGVTVSRCLAAGVLDRLHLVIAPVIIGAGRRGLQHPGPARMADCPRPPARRLVLGEDMLWDLDLRAAAATTVVPG